jgi:hypothetical protein
LQPEVLTAVSFLNKLIKDGNATECFELLADSLKEYVTEDSLQEFYQYYSGLSELWYCTVYYAPYDELTVSIIPMYSEGANSQAKVSVALKKTERSLQGNIWVGSDQKISGLDFGPLDEEAFAKDHERRVISQPKVVIQKDGTPRHIHSPKEEIEAM